MNLVCQKSHIFLQFIFSYFLFGFLDFVAFIHIIAISQRHQSELLLKCIFDASSLSLFPSITRFLYESGLKKEIHVFFIRKPSFCLSLNFLVTFPEIEPEIFLNVS